MVNEGRDGTHTVVRKFIVAECLSPDDAAQIADDTPLITGGILDSITTVKLVSYLENRFGIQFESHEVTVKRLNTIERIIQTIHEKL